MVCVYSLPDTVQKSNVLLENGRKTFIWETPKRISANLTFASYRRALIQRLNFSASIWIFESIKI